MRDKFENFFVSLSGEEQIMAMHVMNQHSFDKFINSLLAGGEGIEMLAVILSAKFEMVTALIKKLKPELVNQTNHMIEEWEKLAEEIHENNEEQIH